MAWRTRFMYGKSILGFWKGFGISHIVSEAFGRFYSGAHMSGAHGDMRGPCSHPSGTHVVGSRDRDQFYLNGKV
jgi:hypothetical protein